MVKKGDKMRTLFGLFEDYGDAHEGVSALIESGFDEDDMNAIVYEDVARIAMITMNVDLAAARARSGAAASDRPLRGLEHLLAGQQAMRIPGLGMVLAAGELATTTVETTATPERESGLMAALLGLGITPDVAEAYEDGIRHGGVLFGIQVDGERAAEAADIMRDHGARRVGHYG